jgi:hypothetical protein
MRLAWHVVQGRRAHEILVGKREGRKPLGISGRRWEDNIKTGVNGTRLVSVDCICVTQARDTWPTIVNTVMKLEFLLVFEEYLA